MSDELIEEEQAMPGEEKYLVIEWEDIENGLSSQEESTLERIVHLIRMHRMFLGKPDSQYVVVNQEEPCFPEVLKLIEQTETKEEIAHITELQQQSTARHIAQYRQEHETKEEEPPTTT